MLVRIGVVAQARSRLDSFPKNHTLARSSRRLDATLDIEPR
jgi:hypothetical protein